MNLIKVNSDMIVAPESVVAVQVKRCTSDLTRVDLLLVSGHTLQVNLDEDQTLDDFMSILFDVAVHDEDTDTGTDDGLTCGC